ncbi:hypothetical protein Clacol_010513 [Clathrus columnatus]|uniref:Benzoate 4-monooxygenase cytochrome P450 n=1 Tax=Clathrus columnatus TaxID=1419009 RepID=A0AAV5ANG3_9AGAM|nr:hypothetical protein Clacol_010513 [Clathrus columnatus]
MSCKEDNEVSHEYCPSKAEGKSFRLDFKSINHNHNWNPWLVFGTILTLLVVHRFTCPDPLADVPGPWLAKYSSLLLAYYTRTGKRYLHVDRLHKKYGPLVRIAPNQVSCAEPSAPSIIYAQGSLSLPKSPFYRSFYVDGTPSLFSTQDRFGHAQKRRVLAHPFSYASVKQFEGWIRKSLRKMIQGLDQNCDDRSGNTQHRFVDLLMWLNYMTFDVISDLAFGEPLGMLDRSSDVLGPSKQEQVGVAAMIDYRGRTAAYLGLFPYLLPGSLLAFLPKWIPDKFLQRGLTGTDTLSSIARRCVRKRLEAGAEGRRGDLLDRLMDSMDKGNNGEEITEADVTTEAMLLLTAGSDTTANSTAAIVYWIIRTPRVMKKLQEEIDEAVRSIDSVLPVGDVDAEDDSLGSAVIWHEQVKNLKYLQATIDEGLRMFATNAFGLPRVVPEGMTVKIGDSIFNEGTVLSAPAYTIQHDPTIWGDPEVFRPERWLEGDEEKLRENKKYLLTFGLGPRACIGKNLASLQMQLLVATLVYRYDFTLRDNELKSVEGFMHKPVDCWVSVTRRTTADA